MSELSFLLDLLLNDKLSKPVREKITARVKEVEAQLSTRPMISNSPGVVSYLPPPKVINGAVQSSSTVAAMERQAQEIPAPELPSVLIASPAAAVAMQSREQAIARSLSSNPEPGRTSPRKF